MELRKPVPSDSSIKVQVFMPASVYQRLREHADRAGSNISRVCREGALRVLAAGKAAHDDSDITSGESHRK
jgi:hypothetical protein